MSASNSEFDMSSLKKLYKDLFNIIRKYVVCKCVHCKLEFNSSTYEDYPLDPDNFYTKAFFKSSGNDVSSLINISLWLSAVIQLYILLMN